MDEQLLAASILGPGDGQQQEPEVSPQLMQDWQDYLTWLDKKGLKGHPSLDHNNLGFKMIEEYRKENPKTLVSKNVIIPIQKELSKYRDNVIALHKIGQAKFTDGVTEDNFLQGLSVVDGIPGQRTTSFSFPGGKQFYGSDGKLIKQDFPAGTWYNDNGVIKRKPLATPPSDTTTPVKKPKPTH